MFCHLNVGQKWIKTVGNAARGWGGGAMGRRRTSPKRNFLFLIWRPFFIGIAAINSPTFTWTSPGKTGGDKRVRLVVQRSPLSARVKLTARDRNIQLSSYKRWPVEDLPESRKDTLFKLNHWTKSRQFIFNHEICERSPGEASNILKSKTWRQMLLCFYQFNNLI